MLPTYELLNAPKPIFRVPFGKIAITVVSLALFGFIFCISWSLLFNFQSSTATHCDVANYLPSISAAIGNYEPQKTVWRLAIILHLPGRLAVAKMYLQYYQERIRRNRRIFAHIAIILNVIEDFALLTLSLWNSSDNYPIHRNSFIVFIVSSELYMLITYFLNKNGRKADMMDIEVKSLDYKGKLFITNVISFFLAGYFFVRHNSHCEPGEYSIFSFFQYVFVMTRGAFYLTTTMDLYNCYLICDNQYHLHFHEYQTNPLV